MFAEFTTTTGKILINLNTVDYIEYSTPVIIHLISHTVTIIETADRVREIMERHDLTKHIERFRAH